MDDHESCRYAISLGNATYPIVLAFSRWWLCPKSTPNIESPNGNMQTWHVVGSPVGAKRHQISAPERTRFPQGYTTWPTPSHRSKFGFIANEVIRLLGGFGLVWDSNGEWERGHPMRGGGCSEIKQSDYYRPIGNGSFGQWREVTLGGLLPPLSGSVL